jgi:hypothetical protein
MFIKYRGYNGEFTKGMVVSTISACFSNNILVPAYFSVKFCIEHLLNVYRIIVIFILLSDSQVLISSVILQGERSFNPPSTPSRLTFARLPSFFHHHLRPPHHKSPPTTPKNPPASPSPLFRDVGSLNNVSAPSEARCSLSRPSPFERDVGAKEEETRGQEKGKGGG